MFSKQKLGRIGRKKKAIVARTDLLREECGEMWSALERRTQVVERKLSNRVGLPPAVTVVARAALLILKTRYLPRKKYLGPLFSLADVALDFTRRPAPREELFTRRPVQREEVPSELYEMHGG